MKSRISFFKIAALRKDITRFFPVWGLYSLGLVLFLTTVYSNSPHSFADNLASSCQFSFAALLYGGICALLLFSDLFSPRMCNAIHALPIRRESWFLTHITAGILFALVPNTLLAVACGVLLQEYAFVAVYWLLAYMGQYLFFFGLAVFCVMCAGNRFSMAVIYAIANCFFNLLYAVISAVYLPLLPGIELREEPFTVLCPAVQLADNRYFTRTYHQLIGYTVGAPAPEAWQYLALCTGLGVVFLAAALLLYRCRRLESAGDFLSVRCLSPVFLLIYTMVAGLVFYLFGEIFSSHLQLFFLFLGATTGFFTGQMLLERRVNVFRGKTFLGYVAVLIGLGLSLAVTKIDPLDLVSYVPRQEQIASVTLTNHSGNHTPLLTDAEDIQDITDLHRNLINTPDDGNLHLTLTYTLKDGKTVTRVYNVSADGSYGTYLRQLFCTPAYLIGQDSWEDFADSVYLITGNTTNIPPEAFPDILDAIYLDCQEGTLAQGYAFHEDEAHLNWLEIYYGGKDSGQLYLDIYDSCVHTIAALAPYQSENYNEKFG